jgi:hypothetical protein
LSANITTFDSTYSIFILTIFTVQMVGLAVEVVVPGEVAAEGVVPGEVVVEVAEEGVVQWAAVGEVAVEEVVPVVLSNVVILADN